MSMSLMYLNRASPQYFILMKLYMLLVRKALESWLVSHGS